MASELNREEILLLLRTHTATLANYFKERNSVPKNVIWLGGGPENRGGLKRINELFEMLPEEREQEYSGGE